MGLASAKKLSLWYQPLAVRIGRQRPSQHRDWWLAVLQAAAIEDFHWHDLRHTFASRLVMNGVDIFTVCRLMRHKNVRSRCATRISLTNTSPLLSVS